MSILFVHSNGIDPIAGGISRTTFNLSQVFKKHGLNVWFLGIEDKSSNKGYDCHQLFLPETPTNTKNNLLFLCDLIKSKDIDIIINQNPFAPAIVELLHKCAQRTETKLVSCFHNCILTPIVRYADSHELLLKKRQMSFLLHLLRWRVFANILVSAYIIKKRKAFRNVVACSDAVIVLSKGQIDELLHMCGYKQCSKIRVIPNCVPISSSLSDCEKKNIVVWAGTFDFSIKRPDLMLKIWKRVSPTHPSWMLYMIGDGPSLSEMKDYSHQLALNNVVFTGRVDPDVYYSCSKIQCVTSVHESFSLVSVEAMSRGNPVIMFNSFSAASSIIDTNTTGFLIEPFNLEEYSSKLIYLMENDSLRELMGYSAKKMLSRFSEENVYALWERVLRV